jgi:hypothetical protein
MVTCHLTRDRSGYEGQVREGHVMYTRAVMVLAVMSVWLLGGQLVWAQQYRDKEHAELAKALKDAKVSLAEGLTASKREGQPISGKFEIEEGKLQLSVYTMKGNAFSEVIVDHMTGKIAKVEPITGGEDLTAAKAQAEAMTKAKQSLGAAVDKAVHADGGFHAVRIFPALTEGHSVAEVTLAKDDTFKTLAERLD